MNRKARLNALRFALTGDDSAIQPAVRLRTGCRLPNKILVGTHHKTGTLWLGSILRAACACHSLKFFSGPQKDWPAEADVLMQHHSEIDVDAVRFPFRGVHIIRDPRDVIISGCFYHQKADEQWLHRRNEKFDGQTYQERINSFGSLDERILFEMEHAGGKTIRDMLNWNYGHPHFRELKYEDLIRDFDLVLFHEIFTFLGFPGSVLPSLLAIAYDRSLFSGERAQSGHVRSGKTAQWKEYFKPAHKEAFLRLFGDALVRLGYEQDDSWASQS
jgi:hypothetical protein